MTLEELKRLNIEYLKGGEFTAQGLATVEIIDRLIILAEASQSLLEEYESNMDDPFYRLGIRELANALDAIK